MTRKVGLITGDILTKNYKIGEPLKSVDELADLADSRKAVYMQHIGLYTPALRILIKSRNLFNVVLLVRSNRIFKLEKINP